MALHVARSRSAECSSTDMSQGRTWSAPAAQQRTLGTSASSRVTTTRDVFSPRLVGVASSLPDFSFQESLQAVTERLRLRSRSSPPDEDRRRSPPRNLMLPAMRHRPARRLLPVPAARPRPLVLGYSPALHGLLLGKTRQAGERLRCGRTRRIQADGTIIGPAVGHRD